MLAAYFAYRILRKLSNAEIEQSQANYQSPFPQRDEDLTLLSWILRLLFWPVFGVAACWMLDDTKHQTIFSVVVILFAMTVTLVGGVALYLVVGLLGLAFRGVAYLYVANKIFLQQEDQPQK